MISRIAPLGLRTCSTVAPGNIGIALYRSAGSDLLGSSVGPVELGTTGGATGAATGADLQAANASMHAATSATRMKRSGRLSVLFIGGFRFFKTVNRLKNNDRIAVNFGVIWQATSG